MEELFRLGPDSLPRFVARWFQPAPTPPTPPPAHGTGRLELPEALRAWSTLTASYQWPSEAPFTTVAPPELDPPTGKIVFLRESQEVYEWACDAPDPTTDDPLVHERAVTEGEPWHPTDTRLSAFLITVAVATAVLTADHQFGRTGLTRSTLDELLRPLTPLPAPGPTLHAQLYADHKADLLAFTGPDTPGEQTPDCTTAWWIHLAARDPERLLPAERLLAEPR